METILENISLIVSIFGGLLLIGFHKRIGIYGAKLHHEFYGFPYKSLVGFNQKFFLVVGILILIGAGLTFFNLQTNSGAKKIIPGPCDAIQNNQSLN